MISIRIPSKNKFLTIVIVQIFPKFKLLFYSFHHIDDDDQDDKEVFFINILNLLIYDRDGNNNNK